MMMIARTPSFVWIAPAICLLAALLPLPYGYYMLLRPVVCGAAAWLAFACGKDGHKGWMGAFIVMALVFNPITPVSFARGVWSLIDVAGVVVFYAHLRHSRRLT